MATFRGFSAVDMRDFGFEEGGDYVSTIATPTTFADVTDGLTAYFIGSGFTYDGNERFTGGTIQRIELRDGSEVIYRLDGSWSAAAAEALYDPVTDEIDIGEYQAFFLGSHDRVTGSAQADYLIGLGGNDTLDGGGGSDREG